MKIRLILGLLILSITLTSYADDPHALWLKSREKMLTNGLCMPEKVRICEEVIDQKGDLKGRGCSAFENDGVISPSRVTAEAWVSNRFFFKRSMVVRKFTADLKSHWKVK